MAGTIDAGRGGARFWSVAWWVVFSAVSVLTLVWLAVGAMVSTPLNEPPGQAIVDYLALSVTPGSVVALLSNGSFDGIHAKLLERLADATKVRAVAHEEC